MVIVGKTGTFNVGFDDSGHELQVISGEQPGAANGTERPPRNTSETAVSVRKAYKSYGSGKTRCDVLRDFNMEVKENTIYGLLGSSGSGKTTILSCIVALRKLDKGNVYIYGEQTGSLGSGVPGSRVGYMPQELALNYECTMLEILSFFGIVFGLTRWEIDYRCEYLIDLLGLNLHKDKTVRDLSDGQKRRVSLAVALIHQPDILILDEPTVGCDSLLRKSIWKYLSDLVLSNSTTVIVTTHYIEETRQADRVGIMRNGRLLVEDSPSRLLRRYNSVLLDDVVLQLCQNDEERQNEQNAEETALERAGRLKLRSMSQPFVDVPDETVNGRPRFISRALSAESTTSSITPNPKSIRNNSIKAREDRSTSIFDRIRALLVKNSIVLMRSLGFVIFLIAMPSICVSVFCIAVGSEPIGLKIGVINEEYQDGMCSDIGPQECTPANLSCLYLNGLDDKAISLIQYDTVEAAVVDVRKRKIWGLLKFDKEFSEFMFARFTSIGSGDISNETYYGSQVRIQLDMSVTSIGLTLQKLFLDGFRVFSEKLLQGCGIDPTGRDIPILFEKPIFGEEGASLTNYMGPGIGLGFTFFMSALTCGLTYILEKKDGMLNRTLVTGVSTLEIIISHFITQFVVLLVQIAIVFFIILFVFGIPCHGSPFLAFALVGLNSIAGMSLGFLVAAFCDEEKNAMLLAMGAVLPNYLLAGLLWPIEGLPIVLQYFSLILPCTLAGEAFRSILLRGFGLDHRVVQYGFFACVAWILIYWCITISYHRLSRSRR